MSTINGQRPKVEELADEVKSNTETLALQATRIDTLDTDVKANTSALSLQDTRIDLLDTDVKANTASLLLQDARISTNETQITNNFNLATAAKSGAFNVQQALEQQQLVLYHPVAPIAHPFISPLGTLLLTQVITVQPALPGGSNFTLDLAGDIRTEGKNAGMAIIVSIDEINPPNIPTSGANQIIRFSLNPAVETKEQICYSASVNGVVNTGNPYLVSTYGTFAYTKDPDGKTFEGTTTCNHRNTITTNLSLAGNLYVNIWATSGVTDVLNTLSVAYLRLKRNDGISGFFGTPIV
jgi:hypothetical protein